MVSRKFHCLIILAALASGINGQGRVVQFTRNMDGLELREDLDRDTLVYTLEATVDGEPSNTVSYSIANTETLRVDELSGDVRLNRLLDYESTQSLSLTVRANMGEDSVEEQVVVNVLDVNDEAPVFVGEPYSASVVENVTENTVIIGNITVTDIDTVNTVIMVECAVTTEVKFRGGCEYFAVRQLESSAHLWRGELYVQKKLDAEKQNVVNVLLRATDEVIGVSTTTVQVDISSIQDAPPIWLPSQMATTNVDENKEADTSVLDFVVMDGDVQNKRDIQLTFLVNPQNIFRLEEADPGSYSLILTRTLDREDPDLIDTGILEVAIRACEVLESGETSTQDRACSTGTVTVRVDDLNDNIPSFNAQQYEVGIPEDISVDTPLPNLNLVVTDHDQGDNAVFDVELLNYTDIFRVMPSRGTRDLTASIYVSNVTNLDYESDMKTFQLTVRVQEVNTKEQHSSTAMVTVNLQDVNDNPPVFAEDVYTASVKESATTGTPVITITASDADSGRFGEPSLYYKLIGNGADKFKCDRRSGQITVASCSSPGSGNCLDAEQTPYYSLTFISADQYGEKFTSSVALEITVTDENDNIPEFTVDNYVSYILEGDIEPDPTVQVQAQDADASDTIRYRITSGNQNNLWQIGAENGIIKATEPVDYESIPGRRDYYLFIVEATDGTNTDSARVTIYVIDINDHAPKFVSDITFTTEIPEDSGTGHFVYQLEAVDQDPSDRPSGQLEYWITGGSQDKFTIENSTGVVTVAVPDAFDYNEQDRYEMKIMAVDQGSPRKSATATLVVNIRDVNNKNPYFDPTQVRREVREDEPVGHSVVTMEAFDPDLNYELVYFLEEPSIRAYNPQNKTLPASDALLYKDLFTIERTTGEVSVNKTLNYEQVARYEAVVKAVDNAGQADQSATASLIITILQVNRRPPEFGEPWTPDNPFLEITVNEGQASGTYVTTLVATDPTDTIQEFRIIEDPGDHFNIDPVTGQVTIQTPLDYEKEQSTRFLVEAVDSGEPQLTSTATVQVTVININDNTPQFDVGGGSSGNLYTAEISENSPGGTRVIQIQSTDGDLGDFGVVEYTLNDPQNRFHINITTGIVTVADGVELDREENATITLTVTAYDSPNNPDVRRYVQIPLYISLIDSNDNEPRFPQNEYLASILESIPPGTSVIQVTANDADTGTNGDLMYYEVEGDPRNHFTIEPSTGIIRVNNSLLGFSGTYHLTIGAIDKGVPSLYGNTRVTIQVRKINNVSPVWIVPSSTNFTVPLIEKQYQGGELIDVDAYDPDPGLNGQVEYGFEVNGDFVDRTPEFVINPITGVISGAQGVEFDREKQAAYTVRLVARDKGENPLETKRFLIFEVQDINDNRPFFDSDCCTRVVEVYEDEKVGTWIGKVTATDLDKGENARVTYTIIGGNINSDFDIDPDTGNLTIRNPLDHETRNLYNLTIFASDGVTTVEPVPQSTVIVYVRVLDRNDFPPKFGQDMFKACVSIDADLGKRVTTMEAVDPDAGGVSYKIGDISSYHSATRESKSTPQDGFQIGVNNGSVFTNMLLDQYEDHYFTLRIRAEDPDQKYDEASLYVWVTEPDQEVTMTFDQPPADVRDNLPNIIETISKMTDGGIVCVGDLTYHITVNNVVDRGQTDLTFHVINNTTFIVIPPGVVINRLEGQMAAFGVVSIKESYTFWDGFDIDPVLAAVIVIFILLLIALLLLCCLCCCLGLLFKKTETYGYMDKPLYLGTINPLWGHKFYEDQELHMAVKDYETVQASPGGAGVVNKAFDATDLTTSAEATNTKVTETKTEYHYQKTTGGTANGHVISGTDVRIEAPLEGGASGLFSASEANMVSSQLGSYPASMTGMQSNHRVNLRSASAVRDDDRSDFGGSAKLGGSRTGFGATLTRPDSRKERVYGADTMSDFGGYHHHSTGTNASRYRLYTGSQSQLPTTSGTGSVNLLQPVPADPGLSSSSPNLYSYSTLSRLPDPNEGYIDLVDGGDTYQGEIHVGTLPRGGGGSAGMRTTYVERRETREVLN